MSRVLQPRVLGYIIIFLVCALAMIPGSRRNPQLSIYDEATHLDNAWRLAHFDIPQVGEKISPTILSEWTCRGFYDPEVKFPECTPPETVEDKSFPFSLSNYNTKHPPLYYAITGVIARVAVAVTPIDSFVTASRIANSFWVALTLIAAWNIGRLLDMRRWQQITLSMAAIALPVPFSGWLYVSNDVGSYATSWIIAAVTLQAAQRGISSSIKPLVIAAVAACLTKGFTFGAVMSSAIVLLTTAVSKDRIERQELHSQLKTVALMVGSGIASVIGWLAFNRIWTSEIPFKSPIVRKPLEGIPWGKISSQIIRFEFPIGELPNYLSTGFAAVDHSLSLWLLGLGWLLTAAPLVAMLSTSDSLSRGFGASAFLGFPLVALMITSFNLLDGTPSYIRVIDRYHIAVMPFSLVALALVSRHHRRFGNSTLTLVGAGTLTVLACYFFAVL